MAEERDRIPDLLGALGDAPVPPLVDAAQVRARGDRRRRRTQVALACAVVLAVAGTGAAATTLLDGSPRDELGFADPVPEPTETTFFCASSQPEVPADDPSCPPPAECPPAPPGEPAEQAYCSDLSIVEVPPDAPEPSITPESTGLVWNPASAFLPPETAARVESPGWAVDPGHEPSRVPLLDPCRDGAFMAPPVALEERAMGSQREAGGSRLVQQVLRYASSDEAADAFDGFADDVAACPEAPAVEGGGVNRFEVAGSGTVDGARTLLVQVQPCGDQGDCTAHFRSYLMLAQSGDGLTLAFYGLGEDGDPLAAAAALLDEVAAQLNQATSGAATSPG